MCRVQVTCGGGGGGLGAGLLLVGGVFVAGWLMVSALSAVLVSIAALVTTAIWALATVAAVAALGTAAVYVTREVLEYRADQRDAEQVQRLLVARGVPTQAVPPAASGLMLAGGRRLPLTAGRDGSW
jgi:hypothetical protein